MTFTLGRCRECTRTWDTLYSVYHEQSALQLLPPKNALVCLGKEKKHDVRSGCRHGCGHLRTLRLQQRSQVLSRQKHTTTHSCCRGAKCGPGGASQSHSWAQIFQHKGLSRTAQNFRSWDVMGQTKSQPFLPLPATTPKVRGRDYHDEPLGFAGSLARLWWRQREREGVLPSLAASSDISE